MTTENNIADKSKRLFYDAVAGQYFESSFYDVFREFGEVYIFTIVTSNGREIIWMEPKNWH